MRRIEWLAETIELILLGLALVLIGWLANFGCSHAEPVHPVAIVAWPAPMKPTCDLPPTPPPPTMVGFPIEGKIYVSVSDLTALEQYQSSLHAWIQEAAICLSKVTSP